MITQITDAPENIVAFRATGIVTKADFETVVIPAVDAVVAKTGELNYLLALDTDVSNFEAGAWLQDIFLGIKNIAKWNRAAIVTDSTGVQVFTDIFSLVTPGEFKGFKKEELQSAIDWVSAPGVSENMLNFAERPNLSAS